MIICGNNLNLKLLVDIVTLLIMTANHVSKLQKHGLQMTPDDTLSRKTLQKHLLKYVIAFKLKGTKYDTVTCCIHVAPDELGDALDTSGVLVPPHLFCR